MLAVFRGFGEKFRNMMLAPMAKDPYQNAYYEDDDYDDYDYEDEGYHDDIDVRYTPRDSRDRDRDRDRDKGRDSRDSAPTRGKSSRSSSRTSAISPAAVDNVLGFNPSGKKEAFKPETIIAHPKEVEDAVELASHVRNGRLCVVDLTGVDANDAQRIADYLGGVCQALDGSTTRVNNGIFAVSPPNHKVNFAYGRREDAEIFTTRMAR